MKDQTAIADPNQRLRAERAALRAGKSLIFDRARIKTGEDYFKVVRRAAAQEGLD